VNDAPVAVNDRYELPVGEETSVTAAQGVLANDTDADTPALTAQLLSSPTNGAFTWNTDGSFKFTPNPGFLGSVTFTYRVGDGSAFSGAATVTLNVANQAAIAISEIMFNAASGLPADEWVEVRNTGATPVNLQGWKFSRGINFTFPDAMLAPGGFLVVAANVPAFQALFPAVSNVVGPWTGGLSNRGETVQLDNALGRRIDAVNPRLASARPTAEVSAFSRQATVLISPSPSCSDAQPVAAARTSAASRKSIAQKIISPSALEWSLVRIRPVGYRW